MHVTEVVPLLECRLTISNSLGQPIATLDSEALAPDDVRDPALGPRIECEVARAAAAAGSLPRSTCCSRARNQIQDGLQAAVFFDVEPGVVGERPTAAEADGDVVLPHVCVRTLALILHRSQADQLSRSSSPPTKRPRRSASGLLRPGADLPAHEVIVVDDGSRDDLPTPSALFDGSV